MKKGTILILVNHDVVIYNFRKELVQELLNEGYEVIISSPYGKKIDCLIEMGCKYSEVTIERHGVNTLKDAQLIYHYIQLIKDTNPLVVLTYTIKPNIYGGIAAQLTSTPYLANITGLGTAIENKGIMQKISLNLYKVGLRKANCVYFQNESNYRTFKERNIVREKAEILPGSGVNLEEHNFESYPEVNKETRILFIGRIMKDKGINELLEAAKVIKSEYPNVYFDIIGFSEGDYSTRIKEYEEAGIVEYYGNQNNVHNFIERSHATVLPSYHEGMANVLLETASTGRPVIATNIPGCRETFDEGLSGFGFVKKDTNSLVNVLKKFIELPYETKVSMGIAGRIKMQNEFDRKIIINNYMEKIKSVGMDEENVIRENS